MTVVVRGFGRRRARPGASTLRAVAVAAAAVAASAALGDFRSGQLSLFLTLALLAVSLDLVWGYAGILSLGQLVPFGTGAYVTAVITDDSPTSSMPALLVAALVGAALSSGIGLAAFRRRLSLVVVGLFTLMLSLTFEQIAEQWRSVTGGFNGLTDIPRLNLLGLQLGDGAQDLVITATCVLAIAAVRLLLGRPIGAALIGVRDNERRMDALGYDTERLKLWAFGLGGALAGLAGALYVHRTGFVSPGIFGLTLATNIVLWTLIGGRGTVVGPVIGTLVINFTSAALADVWLQYWVLATGVVFVAAAVLVPEGLVPRLLRLVGRPVRRPADPMLSVRVDPPAVDGDRALLVADGIDKAFGSFVVLDGISISIERAELRCLIGPNGAGKSTLLDILCGQQGHQRGVISVFGEDVTGRRGWQFARCGVSRKFQAPHVIDSLSVAENLAIAAWGPRSSAWFLVRTDWSVGIGEGAAKILERTTLGDRCDVTAGALSHGEKQWLEIAMALAAPCRLLLLDEPTAGLTAAESLDAAALLRDLHAELALPIVIVEHDMSFIRAAADRVTVLARGELIADGTVADVEVDPAVRSVYLGDGA
ncbi:MAG: ATP-binding cassette domain-containing protein [Actinomycetota bacterium]